MKLTSRGAIRCIANHALPLKSIYRQEDKSDQAQSLI